MMDSITAITLTRNRSEKLMRAVRSVAGQQCQAALSHLVLVDDCEGTAQMLASHERLPKHLDWELIRRHPGEVSGPARSSRLRNYGVRRSQSRWIAFLDDDNEWDPSHLQNLVNCAHRTGCRAVHSHLQIRREDGSLYLDAISPWSRDPAEGRRKYEEMVRQ